MTYPQRLRNYVVDHLRANPSLHVQIGIQAYPARDFASRLADMDAADLDDADRLAALEAIAYSLRAIAAGKNGR